MPDMDGPRAKEILDSYESLCAVTSRMRQAALSEDWDALIALEAQCASIFSRLVCIEDGAPRSEAYQRRKAELISRVLDDDAEIRERANAQLAGIWRMVDGKRNVRRVESTYRVEDC
ncbi:MAG: flagellar protein FliT [Burkholderiales bacterium]